MMKNNCTTWLSIISLLSSILFAVGVELTFELPDNAKQCFYEVIEKNTSATLEFQVNNH